MTPKHRCSTWDDFRRVLHQTVFAGGNLTRGRFLFRGQGSAEWPLQTSFDRAFSHIGDADRRAVENALVANFRKLCEADKSVERLIQGDEQTFLAYAQHFGLPTRLLDWTESPYIAAFFAFEGRFQTIAKGAKSADEVAIWMLDRRHHVWSADIGVEVFTRPSWDNLRMRQQLGWFTLSKTPFRDLEEFAEKTDKTGNALAKITISSRAAKTAIEELEMMNINYDSLFGDAPARAKAAVSKTLLDFSP